MLSSSVIDPSTEDININDEELYQMISDVQIENKKIQHKNEELNLKLNDATKQNQILGLQAIKLDQEILSLQESIRNNSQLIKIAKKQALKMKTKRDSIKEKVSRIEEYDFLDNIIQSISERKRKMKKLISDTRDLVSCCDDSQVENSLLNVQQKIFLVYWSNSELIQQLEMIYKYFDDNYEKIVGIEEMKNEFEEIQNILQSTLYKTSDINNSDVNINDALNFDFNKIFGESQNGNIDNFNIRAKEFFIQSRKDSQFNILPLEDYSISFSLSPSKIQNQLINQKSSSSENVLATMEASEKIKKLFDEADEESRLALFGMFYQNVSENEEETKNEIDSENSLEDDKESNSDFNYKNDNETKNEHDKENENQSHDTVDDSEKVSNTEEEDNYISPAIISDTDNNTATYYENSVNTSALEYNYSDSYQYHSDNEYMTSASESTATKISFKLDIPQKRKRSFNSDSSEFDFTPRNKIDNEEEFKSEANKNQKVDVSQVHTNEIMKSKNEIETNATQSKEEDNHQPLKNREHKNEKHFQTSIKSEVETKQQIKAKEEEEVLKEEEEVKQEEEIVKEEEAIQKEEEAIQEEEVKQEEEDKQQEEVKQEEEDKQQEEIVKEEEVLKEEEEDKQQEEIVKEEEVKQEEVKQKEEIVKEEEEVKQEEEDKQEEENVKEEEVLKEEEEVKQEEEIVKEEEEIIQKEEDKQEEEVKQEEIVKEEEEIIQKEEVIQKEEFKQEEVLKEEVKIHQEEILLFDQINETSKIEVKPPKSDNKQDFSQNIINPRTRKVKSNSQNISANDDTQRETNCNLSDSEKGESRITEKPQEKTDNEKSVNKSKDDENFPELSMSSSFKEEKGFLFIEPEIRAHHVPLSIGNLHDITVKNPEKDYNFQITKAISQDLILSTPPTHKKSQLRLNDNLLVYQQHSDYDESFSNSRKLEIQNFSQIQIDSFAIETETKEFQTNYSEKIISGNENKLSIECISIIEKLEIEVENENNQNVSLGQNQEPAENQAQSLDKQEMHPEQCNNEESELKEEHLEQGISESKPNQIHENTDTNDEMTGKIENIEHNMSQIQNDLKAKNANPNEETPNGPILESNESADSNQNSSTFLESGMKILTNSPNYSDYAKNQKMYEPDSSMSFAPQSPRTNLDPRRSSRRNYRDPMLREPLFNQENNYRHMSDLMPIARAENFDIIDEEQLQQLQGYLEERKSQLEAIKQNIINQITPYKKWHLSQDMNNISLHPDPIFPKYSNCKSVQTDLTAELIPLTIGSEDSTERVKILESEINLENKTQQKLNEKSLKITEKLRKLQEQNIDLDFDEDSIHQLEEENRKLRKQLKIERSQNFDVNLKSEDLQRRIKEAVSMRPVLEAQQRKVIASDKPEIRLIEKEVDEHKQKVLILKEKVAKAENNLNTKRAFLNELKNMKNDEYLERKAQLMNLERREKKWKKIMNDPKIQFRHIQGNSIAYGFERNRLAKVLKLKQKEVIEDEEKLEVLRNYSEILQKILSD